MKEQLNKTKPETVRRATQVLMAIDGFFKEHGWWPSLRELVALTDLKSTSTVRYHLELLEEMGFIERKEGSPRAMTIRKPGRVMIDGAQGE